MAHICSVLQRALSALALPGAAKIQNDLRILTERLARINDNLSRKISSRNEYDKTIQETEGAYAKVRPRSSGTTRRPISPYPRGGLAPPPSLRGPIYEACPAPQVMVSYTYHSSTYYGYTYYGRSWRARKRCCMCSSGSPPI